MTVCVAQSYLSSPGPLPVEQYSRMSPRPRSTTSLHRSRGKVYLKFPPLLLSELQRLGDIELRAPSALWYSTYLKHPQVHVWTKHVRVPPERWQVPLTSLTRHDPLGNCNLHALSHACLANCGLHACNVKRIKYQPPSPAFALVIYKSPATSDVREPTT